MTRQSPLYRSLAQCLRALVCIALLGTGSQAAAQDLDCRQDLAELRALLQAAAEQEPGILMLNGLLDRAEEACLDGQMERYISRTNTARTLLTGEKLDSDGTTSTGNVPELKYLIGTWCYAHESGERAEYEVMSDGTYSARVSEYRWQEVESGPVNAMFDNMQVVDKSMSEFRVKIGYYHATFSRGACDRG